jgi:hypothetical protein
MNCDFWGAIYLGVSLRSGDTNWDGGVGSVTSSGTCKYPVSPSQFVSPDPNETQLLEGDREYLHKIVKSSTLLRGQSSNLNVSDLSPTLSYEA